MIKEDYLKGEIKSEEFLAQELLIPGASNIDGMRTLIFSKHSSQVAVPIHPEPPKICTGYENFIGRNSYGVQRITGTILFVNELFIVYLDENEIVQTIVKEKISKTIENFGLEFEYNDSSIIRNQKVNDYLVKTCSHFDESGENFGYGVNLLTASFSYLGSTFEDCIVIRRSVAEEKMRYKLVKEILISANYNDVFLNQSGNLKNYKPFYEIGENVDKILAVRRKADYSNLKVLLPEALLEVNPNDTIISARGKILDINVYCNDPAELAKRPAFSYINEVYLKKKELYVAFVKRIKELDYKLSHETIFHFNRSQNHINGKWSYEGNEFDFLNIEFVISEEKGLESGSKITDRMAGKGVCARIVDDDKMPVTEDGEIIDLVINPIAPENRLIAAKRYELEVNFIIMTVIKALNIKYQIDSQVEDYFEEFLVLLNDIMIEEDFNDFLNQISLELETNKDIIIDLVKEISSFNYAVTIRPFMNKYSFEWLKELYTKYKVEPKLIRFSGKDGNFMNQKMIYGYSYWMILRHQPAGKASARNVGYHSRLNLPAKTISDRAANPLEIGSTPIRMGECLPM